MKWKVIGRPLYMIWLLNLLTIGFWIAPHMVQAFPAPFCSAMHSDFDSTRSRRFYQQFMATATAAPETIEVSDSKGVKSRIPTPDYLRAFLDPVKQLNISTMGVLGDIFDLVPDPSTGKIQAVRYEWRAREVERETRELLSRAPIEIPQAVKELIGEALQVEELSDKTILVTAKIVSNKALKGLAQAILHRFQQIGMTSVTFAYRKSGLESNEPLTGFTMMDEIIEIVRHQRGFSFHLLFDKAVWDLQMRAITARVQQYNNAKTENEKKDVIRMLNHSKEPFLPFSGIVTTEWVTPGGHPVEMKRYFANELEDPMSFTQLSEKNEFKLRHQMLHQVIQSLPAHSQIEVHAHSVLHRRAYVKLGLKVVREEENPLYPGVKVYVLQGQRENVLSAISAILDKTE